MSGEKSKNVAYRALRYAFRRARESYRTLMWDKNLIEAYAKNHKRLLALKGLHQGKPCVVIGGGPSLNKMDLNQLKDVVTIACNGFYLKHESLSFVPTYYTVEDPLPAQDNREQISGLKSTTKIIPYDLKDVIKEDEVTVYINFRRLYMRSSGPKFPLYTRDFAKECFWGGTVLYMNIQLAEFLGCNPIYLIGVDLSYKIPQSVQQAGAVLTSTEDDENHFDPRYFGAGKRWHLPETARMQKAFTTAYEELRGRGIQLINAGVDSKLADVPRVSFQKITANKGCLDPP